MFGANNIEGCFLVSHISLCVNPNTGGNKSFFQRPRSQMRERAIVTNCATHFLEILGVLW
jgi:hypothetical protein